MGAWNFMVDMGQYATLSEHQERIEELEKKIEIMAEWIGQLRKELKEREDDSSTGL